MPNGRRVVRGRGGGGGGGGSQSNNSGTQGEGHQLRGWRTAVDIYSYVICSGLKYN